MEKSKLTSNSRLKKISKKSVFKPRTQKGRQQMAQVFFDAIVQSDVERLKECLLKDIDPNIVNEEGETGLHIAAQKGDMELCKVLLSVQNIDVNIATERGITALMTSVIYDHRHFCRALLQNNADPNLRDINDNMALHYAVKTSNIGITFDLVYLGAEVDDTSNVFGQTVLSLAVIEYPNAQIANFLLRKGAQETVHRDMPIILEAVLNCNNSKRLKLLDIIIQNGHIDINRTHPITKMNCLHIVAMTGYFPLAVYLLKNKADADALDIMNRTPKMVATEHGHKQIRNLFAGLKRHKGVAFATPSK